MSTKQGSIAGFFARKPATADTKTKIKAEIKPSIKSEGSQDENGVIDLTSELEDTQDIPRKRRKLSSPSCPGPISKTTKAVANRLTIDTTTSFDYPPTTHPSYHPPPSSSYNHPFPISPPPPQILEALSFSQSPKPMLKPNLNLDLLYFNQFISPPGSRMLYDYFLEALPWYRVKYTKGPYEINTPRWTTVFGKDSSPNGWGEYGVVKPRAIPEILLRLMEIVEKVTGETYNFTLVNYYATGQDSISYHSDSESFLGQDPCIASLSLGSSRDFYLRHIKHKENKAPIEKFALKDGDMVVMRAGTQANWEHSIPKRQGNGVGGRINVTFRKGVVRYATKNYLDYNVGKGGVYRWIKGEMVEQK